MPLEFIQARMEKNGEKCGPKHGRHHRSGSRGPKEFGANKPWLRIVMQFMTEKKINAEQLSEIASQNGIFMPAKFINKKISNVDKDKRNGSSSRSHSPRKHADREMHKCLKEYLKSQNIEASTISTFAKENGFNVKEKRVEKFFNVNGNKHCKAAKQAAELVKCARENCSFMQHSKQKHGFCCGACNNKGEGKHGNGCEHVA